MTFYQLSANPATKREHGYMVSYSLMGLRLVNDEGTANIKTPAELEAATLAHAALVLESNPELTAVSVSRKPVTRHANGCKALRYSVCFDRDTTPDVATDVTTESTTANLRGAST